MSKYGYEKRKEKTDPPDGTSKILVLRGDLIHTPQALAPHGDCGRIDDLACLSWS